MVMLWAPTFRFILAANFVGAPKTKNPSYATAYANPMSRLVPLLEFNQIGKPRLCKVFQGLFQLGKHLCARTSLVIAIHLLIQPQTIIPE